MGCSVLGCMAVLCGRMPLCAPGDFRMARSALQLKRDPSFNPHHSPSRRENPPPAVGEPGIRTPGQTPDVSGLVRPSHKSGEQGVTFTAAGAGAAGAHSSSVTVGSSAAVIPSPQGCPESHRTLMARNDVEQTERQPEIKHPRPRLGSALAIARHSCLLPPRRHPSCRVHCGTAGGHHRAQATLGETEVWRGSHLPKVGHLARTRHRPHPCIFRLRIRTCLSRERLRQKHFYTSISPHSCPGFCHTLLSGSLSPVRKPVWTLSVKVPQPQQPRLCVSPGTTVSCSSTLSIYIKDWAGVGWHTSVIPVPGRLRQEGCYKFRPAWAT